MPVSKILGLFWKGCIQAHARKIIITTGWIKVSKRQKKNRTPSAPVYKYVHSTTLYTPFWRVGAAGSGKKGDEKLKSQDRVVLSHAPSPLLFIPGM